VANAHLPGLDADTPPTVEEVVGTWTSVPDIAQPGYSGIIVDEFLAQGSDFYHVWTESIRQFYRLPAFENRTFYAWCGGDVFCLEPATDLFRVLQGLGGRFSWEKYLPEPPSESEARRSLISELRVPMQDWQERMPGLEQQLIVCLGYLSAPPETQNRDPGVDNHVFMDMQFQLLATDPAYWNLRGLMEYSARYADEESLRWAHTS
jgi:hypothetical protein